MATKDKLGITADEALRPIEMDCCNCDGRMKVYPYPMPQGSGYCPNCSPAWLENFLQFATNQERTKRGLTTIQF